MTELRQHIKQTPICDTHSHVTTQLDTKPDVLNFISIGYMRNVFTTAGMSNDDMKRMTDVKAPMQERSDLFRKNFDLIYHTDTARSTRLFIERVLEIKDASVPELQRAQARIDFLHENLDHSMQVMKEVAGIHHSQTDAFRWGLHKKLASYDPSFYYYDLSWWAFTRGVIPTAVILEQSGVEVTDIASLRLAMETLYERNARQCIAMKSQHGYQRTLDWKERSDADAAIALDRVLLDKASWEDRLCISDWSFARGVELAIKYNLPVKLHTGYNAGIGTMTLWDGHPANLCPIVKRYPECRFILLHTAWPFTNEAIAMIKHFPNVYGEMSWIWSNNSLAAIDLVRRFIHSCPSNKLFCFGSDSDPLHSVAYALQAREGLARALEEEVEDNWITENEAKKLATRFMVQNAKEFFDLEGVAERARKYLASLPKPKANEKVPVYV